MCLRAQAANLYLAQHGPLTCAFMRVLLCMCLYTCLRVQAANLYLAQHGTPTFMRVFLCVFLCMCLCVQAANLYLEQHGQVASALTALSRPDVGGRDMLVAVATRGRTRLLHVLMAVDHRVVQVSWLFFFSIFGSFVYRCTDTALYIYLAT
jgi:uncharacterized membrane protein